MSDRTQALSGPVGFSAEILSAPQSQGNSEWTEVSLEDILDAEDERNRIANAEIAARVNVTKLKAMLEELKHRKKLSDEDDEL